MPNQSGTDCAVHRLEISNAQLHQMIAHVQEWLPFEGCGLLATDGPTVARVFPGENVKRSEVLYEMNPKQVLDATREIDESGWRLGATFHSHPSSQAWPSKTDLELIFDPDVYMIIISLADEEPVVRAFRYDGEIREVPIEILDGKGIAS